MTDIVFANRDNPIVPDSAIIHDNESFRLQWSALNTSDKDVAAFVGRLVITSIPEGCPGSDDREHEIVFDRDVGGIRGRGAGRLVITLKPMPSRVTAEWMAQQWRDGKRIKKKLGNYPSMSLAQAREVFNRDFADMIQKGRSIKIAGDTRPGTVADLFEGYVQYLKDAGKPSWKETEKGLNRIADTLGRNRFAREIEPGEITEIIRPIYERGKRSMADHVRGYIHAAYGWGLKSEHDYRTASRRRFRLAYNPASGIPTEPKIVGTRWLDEDEFVRLYRRHGLRQSPSVAPVVGGSL